MIANATPAEHTKRSGASSLWERCWFLLTLAVLLLVQLAWLTRYPALHVDEAQNINWFLSWWHGTWPSTSMDRLVYPKPFMIAGAFGLTLIGSLETFGIGLLQARVVPFVWGLALLAVTY